MKGEESKKIRIKKECVCVCVWGKDEIKKKDIEKLYKKKMSKETKSK